MSVVSRLLNLWRNLLHRSELERDLDDELRAYVDLLTEERVNAGLSRAEARRAALVEVHTLEGVKEEVREVRAGALLETIGRDVRYAVRGLRRSPAFAIAAVVTLALGIGPNTAIFSAVSAVILRPLPVAAAGRLVMVWEENPDFHWYQQDAAPANYLDWKEQVGAFQDAAAYPDFAGTATLTGYGEPRLLKSLPVPGNFFEVLGVRPGLGRAFRAEEPWQAGGTPTAILSYQAWREVFGADRGLVGRTVQLDGRATEIVGVLPPGFALPGLDVDVWGTAGWDQNDRVQAWFRRAHWLRVIARLKPGVTLERARAELQTVVTRLQREYPATNVHMGAGLTPLHEFLVGKTRLPLLVLLGAVALLLLIACANVGNLLLARALGREREGALRLALGAGRGRVVRQALTESLVLSALGAGAGLALGWWGTRALAALQPAGMLPANDFGVSWSVLAYVLTAATLSGLLFGIAPALWTGRRVPAEALKEEGGGHRSSGGHRIGRWSDALVVGEVALALALTLGAGLLVRSYLLLQRVDPGFEASGVLTARVDLPGIRFDSTTKVLAFYEDLAARARSVSGVEAAAVVSQLPATRPPWSSEFSVAGRGPGERGAEVVHRELSPDYQKVMRVPLLRGRLFTDQDRQHAPMVVLINQALARAYFGGENPIGQRVAFDRVPDSTSIWRTIVGVVGNERQTGLAEDPRPEFLAPYGQEARNAMTLVVRTRGDPLALAPAVRRIVKQLDPNLAITSVRTMEQVEAEALARNRFLTTLLLAFAGVGVGLAVIGVYGVVAQLARRRVRELGNRIALGAPAAQIQWMVVGHGLGLAGAGVAIGLAVSLGATRAIRTLLYHVAPADTLTFVTIPLLLLGTAVLAAWLPAQRASRSDPSEVLRAE